MFTLKDTGETMSYDQVRQYLMENPDIWLGAKEGKEVGGPTKGNIQNLSGDEMKVIGDYVVIGGNIFDASKTEGSNWEYNKGTGSLVSTDAVNKKSVKAETSISSHKEALVVAKAFQAIKNVDASAFKPIINSIAEKSGMSAPELIEAFGSGKPIPAGSYSLTFPDFE